MAKETWVPVADVKRRLKESRRTERHRIMKIVADLKISTDSHGTIEDGWYDAMHQVDMALKRDDIQQSRIIDTTCTCREKICSKMETPSHD